MFSSRLYWRILLAQLLLITVSAVVLVFVISRYAYRQQEQNFAKHLQQLTDQLTTLIAVEEKSLLEHEKLRNLRLIALAEGLSITIFSETGEVMGSTSVSSGTAPLILHSLHQQLRGGQTSEQTVLDRGNEKSRNLIVQSLNLPQSGRCYLQIEASRVNLENQESEFSTYLLLTTALVLMVGFLVSAFVASRLTKPLEDLTRASQAIRIGNLYETIPVDTNDELGTLAKTFNLMSQELSTRIQELQNQGQLLQANSERLATVLGGMVEGVIAVDSNDRILFANAAAFRMIEFIGRRVIGRPYWEVLRNSDVIAAVRDVLSGQYQLKREIKLARSQSVVAFIASRLPGDPCPGVVLVLHDVTELRRLEKIRSEFVSNVGHELKTPVAAIQACTETLAGGALDDPGPAQHFLTQISEHADRLHKLIIDLMELAKIESEEDAFVLETLDIGIPIQEAIDEHFSVADAKQIKLSYQSTIDELPVRADHDGIRTILNNLLDNAINYTPPGGRVHVEWFQQEQQVVIKVRDTGIGIERNHLERIFERFYRVDAARARDAGGTGLGLAIVKHLCQFFSGHIDVTSEPGRGTEFIIQFPLQTGQFAADLSANS